MNKRGSADKIKLSSFDDLFGTQEAGTGTEQVQEILTPSAEISAALTEIGILFSNIRTLLP